MRLFGTNDARYYCESFTICTGDSEGSIDSFVRNRLVGRGTTITEGTGVFEEYRSCSLRNAERSLFLAMSHYRRCLDHMLPSGSSWAYVTIYYGCWHAAHALLGMLGCTISTKFVIDVIRSTPGIQAFSIRRIGSTPGGEPTTYNGSHEKFWDLFYRAFIPLRPIVPPHLVVCWLNNARNSLPDLVERSRVGYPLKTGDQPCVVESPKNSS